MDGCSDAGSHCNIITYFLAKERIKDDDGSQERRLGEIGSNGIN